jgi:flavin reductase (DIM6/NTAB) family NADH-FMN oxidoreductase RutF
MSKQTWKPSTLLNPVPAVMVSCADEKGTPNIITLAWAGTICSEPPMLSVSIRKERFSYEIIKKSGVFVVNLVTKDLCKACDYCGVKSGRDIDKFKTMGLSAVPSSIISAPMIKESPVSIECVVKEIKQLGSHDMFISEIVAVNVEESLIDESGKLDMMKAGLICYSHGNYWTLGEKLGFFGYSVAKKKVDR